MKSRSNSSNEVAKQAFEAKIFIGIKILFIQNVFRPVFTETELQINRKTIQKMTMLKNPNMFLKTNIFEN